jgi:hypothetical protein
MQESEMSPEDHGNSAEKEAEVTWEANAPTLAESAAYARAVKTTEQTVPLANDFLQKLVALDAVIVGGGFVVAKGEVLPFWAGLLALTFLLGSLGFAIYGLRPIRRDVDVYGLNGIVNFIAYERDVVAKKELAISWSTRLLFAAFIIGVVGLAAKGPPSTP